MVREEVKEKNLSLEIEWKTHTPERETIDCKHHQEEQRVDDLGHTQDEFGLMLGPKNSDTNDNAEERQISFLLKDDATNKLNEDSNSATVKRIGFDASDLHDESVNTDLSQAVLSRNEKRYNYIRKGARIKAILSVALQATEEKNDYFPLKNSGDEVNDSDHMSSEKKRAIDDDQSIESDEQHFLKKYCSGREDSIYIMNLAKEKAEECISLKRKLQDSESQVQFLQHETSVCQQTISQLQSKIERTLEALQIAGKNAADSRAEAEASNDRANFLSNQLSDLQSVVEETRRSMEIIRREHDEVSSAARSVEERLIQVESGFMRASRMKKESEDERDIFKSRAEKSEKLFKVLQEKVDDYEEVIRLLKRDLAEMEDLEKVRSDRTDRLAAELEIARSALLEATSAVTETESTAVSLRSVVDDLRNENESLHGQMSDYSDSISKDRVKQNETLLLTEKELQKWKLKYEEEHEQTRILKMDKTAAETELEQMKSRLSSMEQRMHDYKIDMTPLEKTSRSSAVTPTPLNLGVINSFGINSSLMDSDLSMQRTYISQLPMRENSASDLGLPSSKLINSSSGSLDTVSKGNSSPLQQSRTLHEVQFALKRKPTRSKICCICKQEAIGIMKNCQCDHIKCDKRAHMTCIAKKKIESGESNLALLCDL